METNDREFLFEKEWPRLAEGVKATLNGMGISGAMADDFLQETAIRVWRNWQTIDPERSPSYLAKTIARNLVRDHFRSSATRHEFPGDLPDRAAQSDAERQGIARAELTNVRSAITKLRASYREALLHEVGLGKTRLAETGAARMTRLRARRELMALVNRSAGFVAAGPRIVSEAFHRVALAVADRLPKTSEALGAALVALIAAVAIPFVGAIDRPDSPQRHLDEDFKSELVVAAANGAALDTTGLGVRPDTRRLVHGTKDAAVSAARKLKDRALGRVRIGPFGNLTSEANVEAFGRRVGTDADGSLAVGCAGDPASEASDLARCRMKKKAHGDAEVRYRVGESHGRVRVPIGD